ncbi:MAG: hypothetical protein AB7F86_15745 [Bdellovibrionales bacterium]
MASVSQFAQHLLRLDPQRNNARLTLYNYMKHLVDPELPFCPALVQEFYARVLQFDQWQIDARTLSDNVRADVLSFLKSQIQETNLEPWEHLRHADLLQVVPLKLFQDLEELVLEEHQSRRKSGDQLRVLRTEDNQCLLLILSATGTMEVKLFPRLALVWGARLRLVAPTSHLYYTHEMELMPHTRQTLEGSLLTIHSFEVTTDGVQGLVTRGPTLQKFETFVRARLPDTQDLFQCLKKLECHFINPQSDPFYQELVGRLERANRILGTHSPDALSDAERALNRGRAALRSIFPNDRLLTLLVTHLEYGISEKKAAFVDPRSKATHTPRSPTQ